MSCFPSSVQLYFVLLDLLSIIGILFFLMAATSYIIVWVASIGRVLVSFPSIHFVIFLSFRSSKLQVKYKWVRKMQ